MTSRSKALGTIVALLLIVGAFLLGRATGVKPESLDPVQPPVSTQAGHSHDETGAVTAAANFGLALAGPIEPAGDYRSGLVSLAAPEWEQEAEDLANSTLTFVRDRYGGDGDLAFAALRYRVNSYSDEEAQVDIWGTTVASGSLIEGVEESWVTGTIDLVWVEGRWLVAGQSSTSGPTPELLGASDDLSFETINDFEEFDHVPTP